MALSHIALTTFYGEFKFTNINLCMCNLVEKIRKCMIVSLKSKSIVFSCLAPSSTRFNNFKYIWKNSFWTFLAACQWWFSFPHPLINFLPQARLGPYRFLSPAQYYQWEGAASSWLWSLWVGASQMCQVTCVMHGLKWENSLGQEEWASKVLLSWKEDSYWSNWGEEKE